MKYRLLLILQFLTVYTLAQPADIRKVQSAVTNGFVLKDSNGIKNYVDDAFVLIHADGSVEGKYQYVHSFDRFTPEDGLSIMLMHDSYIDSQNIIIVRGVMFSQWLEGDNLIRSKVPYIDKFQKKDGKWWLISSNINDSGENYFALGDSAGLRKLIADKYRLLEESFRKRDPDLHFKIKTNDFSMADKSGNSVSPQLVRDQMKALFTTLRGKPEMRNEIEKLEMAEDTVKVTVLQHFKRDQSIDGKIKKIESTVRQRTSWMKTKEGFKLVYIDNMVPISTIIDGTPSGPVAPLAPKAD